MMFIESVNSSNRVVSVELGRITSSQSYNNLTVYSYGKVYKFRQLTNPLIYGLNRVWSSS